MIILGIIIIVFLVVAIYLGRPIYHSGKRPTDFSQKKSEASSGSSSEISKPFSNLWGWGLAIATISAIALVVPWMSKEHVKNISSVEVGKKIAEISSQFLQAEGLLSNEKKVEIKKDLEKIREMSEDKEISSERVVFFVNSIISRHQSDLEKAILQSKKNQQQEAKNKQAKEYIAITPYERAGVRVIFRLPVETKYGDEFQLLEAVLIGTEGGFSFGDYVDIKRLKTSTVPAGFVFKVPPEALKKNDFFELVFLTKNPNSIKEIKLKKKGGA